METLLESLSVGKWKHWTPLFQSAMHVVVIIVLAWLLHQFCHRLLQKFRTHMLLNPHNVEAIKRLETLHRIFDHTIFAAIIVIAGMLILTEVGVSIAPLLGAAGVVGVAVGFGAQSIIKDYFTGFFLLLENQIRQGDVIEAAGKNGEIEEITLRYTRLRDYEGHVHYIPNGLITTVTNKSREFAYAVIEVGIAYKEDIDSALDAINTVARDLRNSPDFGPQILEDIEIGGVENIGHSAITLRSRIKVETSGQADIKREFLKRLKSAFDARGIEIPFPHMTIYGEQNKDGSASPLRVVASQKTD